jgi:murein DD-endopeptidase MepM/ murein hydrolase activator NlpD
MRNELKLLLISKSKAEVKEFSVNKYKISAIILFLVLFLGTSGYVAVNGVSEWVNNTRMESILRTNKVLRNQVSLLNGKIDSIYSQMTSISRKDDDIRLLMNLPKLDNDIRKAGIGGAKIDNQLGKNMAEFFLDDYSRSSLLTSYEKIQQLERQVKFELMSYATLEKLVKQKKDSLRFIPAIFPCDGRRLTDGFGKRRHPITGRIAMHEGLDIAADIGRPVYATADGVVQFAGRNGGYGKSVFLDHKNGFQTRYAHLNKILVNKGQFVKRGDKIGEIGNSGRSTGPHLHYEVRFHRTPLDPMGFFFDSRYLK